MAKISLGLPLAAAAAGTVVTLFVPAKRLHIACGTAWAALSLVHAWQYRRRLAQDLAAAPFAVRLGRDVMKKVDEGLQKLPLPPTKLGALIGSMRPAAYAPGRMRLYSRSLVGNEKLREQILAYFADCPEVDKVECSMLTGSVLITYEPEFFAENEELSQIETYVKHHVQMAQGRS